ncbi:MAG: alkaline phosphatase family protein, partial [Candidatus Hydrogenedentes bacterium]|nr:alkaline phosphatase family protein [Candidatus Hydrogenedentota bacterium]
MHARCYFLLAVLCFAIAPVTHAGESPNTQVLLIVLDGLRPDYVTPVLMPNLYALGQRGVVCENHHAVFPTVTRVNASSIATGSYPATHGLMGNTVFFPEVEPKRGLSTGDARNLMRIEEVTGGRLLTAPSLGELLDAHGKKLLTVSSGSSGSSYLTNHKVRGGGIINVEHILPAEQADLVKQTLGAVPEETGPNRDQNRWAVDAYLKYGLDIVHPDVTIMWISDPDHTTHDAGIGSPDNLACLKNDDEEIGRILATLDQRGLAATTNILVASDHGFSTHTGKSSVTDLLTKAGLKGDDVIVVEGAIYVQNHDEAKIKAIVQLLQETDWIGPIFTKANQPGDPKGFVEGTFSFDIIHWNHARSADILVGANWSDDANALGWKGTTT